MKHLIYDLPTRIFHWLFAGLFLSAFGITKIIDDKSIIFSYHMIIGLIMTFLVLLRLVWGFFGTTHAKFSSFALNPKELFEYFKGLFIKNEKRWSGHNPASSWAGLFMMALALSLGLTGILMTSGPNKETYEDVHEIIANTFIITVILHVLGILFHTYKHKENIGMSMIDGQKENIPLKDKISNPKKLAGLSLLILVLTFTLILSKNFNKSDKTLKIFKFTLQLGENEKMNENYLTEQKNQDKVELNND